MKKCTKCGLDKPVDDFYVMKPATGYRAAECKECTKTRVKKHYADTIPQQHAYEANRNATPERKAALQKRMRFHRARNPDKYKARTAVNNAVRDGRLFRLPCACGSLKVQAHHADYSKPLDVKWVCFRCHREKEHGQTVTSTPAPM